MGILTKVLDVAKGKAPSISTKRSSKWPKVRKEHLKNNPVCIVCGSTKKLEVHHIIPFHENPSLELDPENLVTLCEEASGGIICHLAVGHKGCYKNINPSVLEDANYLKRMFDKEDK